ncbi:FAD binding domain containing protein [Lasiodiplodia theobromae]|uniref:FAD binding domain containing protein n=1 Tax=Lasiodiplodia theobromae TaxID=45133 RepID=UPI0015C2F9B7|nr:FAD binding domain containing protein [Lasiodiplodia theobromae]KAF4535233.1 FAD binding domain containing protein [Lasiodiplodia theobromae]
MPPTLFSLALILAGIAFTNASVLNFQGLRIQNYPNDAISHGCDRACSQLSTSFGSVLHYPENDRNFTIWDAKQQEVRPACRVEPSNAAEVAQVLEILVGNWCRFAVKGGGHSRHPDDSNSVGCVTIDLDRMNAVEVAADKASARVGGGATLLQVYRALERYDLSFVGGLVATVGVGGFTLGGGRSALSNRYGWALDNVYEYEVVLANGTITTASESQNLDLYFALRGGSNNFGIVTTFTVRTFPQGPVLNARVVYSDDQTEQVLDRVFDLFADPKLTSDVDMGYEIYFRYNQTSDSFMVDSAQRYAKPIKSPAVFQAINQIPALSRTTQIDTMPNVVGPGGEMGTVRHLFDTTSSLPSRALLSQAIQIFREEITAIKTVAGLHPVLICYPIQTNAIAAMRQRGGNALGIDQDEPLFVFLVSTGWSSAEEDADVFTMSANTIARIESAAKELGVAHPYRYINYARKGEAEEVFAGYGEANVQRLKEIQRAVDPDGVFTSHGLWTGFMKLL